MLRPDKPAPEPLDPPMVPFAAAGTAIWAVLGLTLLPLRDWLAEHGHTDWLWTCLTGFLLGFPGIAVMMKHDANRRRRREAAARSSPDEPTAGARGGQRG